MRFIVRIVSGVFVGFFQSLKSRIVEMLANSLQIVEVDRVSA